MNEHHELPIGAREPNDRRREPSLVDVLRSRAAESPETVGYHFLEESGDGDGGAGRPLTWAELDRRARAVAVALREAGAAGERALLLYPPGLEYLAAFFGCLYAGTVAVPVYPPRPRRGAGRSMGRLISILTDARAAFALTTSEILAGVRDQLPEGAGPAWLATDTVDDSGAEDWLRPELGPDSLAFLQYTSGSTAEPKGVMLTHGNLLHNLEIIRRSFGVGSDDRAVIWLPPYHDMGLIGGILTPLYVSFPVHLFSPMAFLQRPARWLEAISAFRATVSGGPNFAYELAVRKTDEAKRSSLDLSSWRVAFNGAEPVRSETLERFSEAFAGAGFSPSAFYPCYGLAEATLLVTGGEPGGGARVERFDAAELEAHRAVRQEAAGDGSRLRSLVASGRCAAGQRLLVVDPETGAELPEGAVGEIWVAGPSMAAGYWGKRELTSETFGARPPFAGSSGDAEAEADLCYLKTGDLGFLDGGELFVTGRIKDLIILRGRNCYPQDVEVAAEVAHAALRAGGGAAFGVEVDGEERLVLVQEVRREALRDGMEAALLDEIGSAVRETLAREQEIQLHALALIKPATLPKTSSGKVRRRATREAYLAGTLDLVAVYGDGSAVVPEVAGEPEPGSAPGADRTPAPESDASAAVAAWLGAEVARRAGVRGSRIDAARPLEDHGLDSLSVMEIAHAVEERFGVAVPMERLFGLSVAELAAELASADRAAADEPPEETPETGLHPLSHNQLSLWFLHALEPESPAYNVPAAVRLRGEVDLDALGAAVRQLVARHPALRTTFEVVRGEPRQRVAAADDALLGRIALAEEDARGWSEARLDERLREEARRPFDLERGPLFRAHLFRRSALERVLVFVMHHVVTDFWSLGVLVDELGALYRQAVAGDAAAPDGASSLPPAPGRYTDWAAWQLDMLDGARGEELWSYWRERLAGELPVLELHTDRPRPRVQTDHGATHAERLPVDLSDRLEELARGRGATPFMVLAAGFEALLHRYTGQEDVLLGTVTAGRTRARYARTVGYFVNPLVLRSGLGDDVADGGEDRGFGAHLERVRDDALGALAHQDFPFPLLVERLAPERDPGRSPLVQAMFVYQRAALSDGQDLTPFALGEPGAEVRLGDGSGALTLGSQPLDLGIAQFDVTLTAGRAREGFVASFDYNTDLFDAETVARMARSLRTLLEAAVADPARPVAELPLLSAAEEREVVTAWNDTRHEVRREATLVDLFEEQAERAPEAEAVRCGGRGLTYGELRDRARALAARLTERGVGPEVTVGILLDRSTDLLVAVLGVLGSGAAYLPLDPHDPAERLTYTLGDAAVGLVVTDERFTGLLGQAGEGERRPEAMLIADATAGADRASEPPSPPRPIAPASLACVIYTSGSTGDPKGVLLDHRSLVNLVSSFLVSYEPTPEDRILPLTSLAHASFVGEIFPLLAAGGTLVLPTEAELLDTGALLQAIAREGVSILSTVPSLLATLNAAREELPELRLLLVGGEALSAGDVDRLIGSVRIVNGYGLTEAAVCSTVHEIDESELARRRPRIGRPVINTRVYVLDRYFAPRPVGCPGEIYVAGDGLARGYHARPGQTAERFVPDPFAPGGRLYRTGDAGVWNADGVLEYLGRLDQQVKVRGFRIEPGEIESALALHPAVQEAAVVVRDDLGDQGGDARLVGYVVAAPPSSAASSETAAPTPGALLAHLRERLPDYMVPASFVFLKALPLGPTGKVDVKALPAPTQERPDIGADYRAPKSELERRIAAVWTELLAVESVGLDDNFFDLGGHSLLMTKVHARLKEVLAGEIGALSLIDLFKYPTVGTLAAHLSGEEAGDRAGRGDGAGSERARRRAATPVGAGGSRDIAIVGMSGRFPGAKSPQELWANITSGIESITFFEDEELLAAGIDPELVADPNYIKAKGILGDVDQFDAGFFGLNPREVELMDPQHRVFLECCWEALERAGYDADRWDGSIGVYGGESMNTYMITNLLPHMELVASVETLQAALGNDKDPLTSRVSYKLGLRGPCITIQSASSTSLTAIHVACQSLLQGNCDMALAGGVSIHLPEVSGYRYQEGGTTARDGHCRAFDASATGFVSGHGAAVLVLKRLDEALADGDHIHAVIKAAACNNDGAVKVSYMAPSVDGQVDVYERAYSEAGISPESIGYVECHGTGTALGDPIEMTALTEVYSKVTDRKNFCAIGSLKTNIGHLDTAAGASGLIKAALTVEHGLIPPSLHFETPNPQIDFDSSPFFVNTELRRWEGRDATGTPRRAASTSLGMGGTNAHVVVEEPPAAAARPQPTRSRPWQLLVLSAKSETALDAATDRLGAALGEVDADRPGSALADVAFTLQMGRKGFHHRRMLLCQDGPDGGRSAIEDAARALTGRDPERLLSGQHGGGDRPVAFLFPGQGAQYPGMARGLYDSEPSFREDIDRCAELLLPHLERDLRELLFPEGDDVEAAAEALRQTAIAQPALFTISWATARLWMRWGVKPAAMLGHSIGEYAAACLAGVFTLEDALAVVSARGALMQQMPPGAMLGVPLPEDELMPLLAGGVGGGELSLAAVNRPSVSVVSGPAEAVDELAVTLTERGLACRRLHTSHAFHSKMMDPVLPAFTEMVKGVRLEPPKIPYVSNVTGTWIRPEEATDPTYYARQLRGAVRFADGVGELLAEPQRLLLEVGPGNTLSTLARQHPARKPAQAVVSSLRHPKEDRDDQATLLEALGRLWLTGATVDWQALWEGERRLRVPLPTYPFERQRYWVDPPAAGAGKKGAAKKAGRQEPADWFYAPTWHRLPERAPAGVPPAGNGSHASDWLLFLDGAGVGAALAERLSAAGHRVATVEASRPGEGFGTVAPGAGNGSASDLARARFRLEPGEPSGYQSLFEALRERGNLPGRIVHLWSVTGGAAAGSESAQGEVLDRSFYSLLHLTQALTQALEPALAGGLAPGQSQEADQEAGTDVPDGPVVHLSVVSDGLQEVTGDEELHPLKATLLGPCGVIPRELPAVACRSIDLRLATNGGANGIDGVRIAEALLGELFREEARPVALRGRHRWVRAFEPVRLERPEGADGTLAGLRPEGVYVVTGGLGGIGLELAEELARELRARLVLVGRSPFPARDEWDQWLEAHGPDDPVSTKIGRLAALEEAGAQALVVSADVSRTEEVEAVRAAALERFGAVHGVIHAAGVAGGGLIAARTRDAAERVLSPKVRGTLALESVFGSAPLDCFVLLSSVTGVVPQIGQADYAAANCFLDAFATWRAARGGTGHRTVSIGWDAWRETGMAVATEVPAELAAWREETLRQGLSSAEGVDAFRRVLASGLSRVVVSTLDLDERFRAADEPEKATLEALDGPASAAAHPRPALANPFVAPTTEREESVAAIWQEILGIDRVGIHDNFFDLGGNSLAGLRITRALKERLGASISDVSLYEAPTVATLTRLIDPEPEGEGAAGPDQVVAEVASRDRGERRKARLMRRRREVSDE